MDTDLLLFIKRARRGHHQEPNAANVPTEEQAVADIPAPPVEESSTEASQAMAVYTRTVYGRRRRRDGRIRW